MPLAHRICRLVSFFGARTVLAGATAIGLSLLGANVLAQSVTRPYQMSILAAWRGVTSASVDVPIFTRNVFGNNQSQPAGLSIAWLPPDANLDRHNIDWSRIVAVYVDEPYDRILQSAPCNVSDPGGTPEFSYPVNQMMLTLRAMAREVRARAPKARFWVNFTAREIDSMLTPESGCPLNQPYIDVISMDIYDVSFIPEVSTRYSNLYRNRATSHQQLALVPGTFTGGYRNQSGVQGAARLAGYFAYAASMNQQCALPLGPQGSTGFYDGCPIWMVAGWSGGVEPYVENGITYYLIDHPNSQLVFDTWQTQVAIPRVDPSQTRRMRQLIPLLTD